jgi:alpha-tubulin suppressor-like RCC1 family protein
MATHAIRWQNLIMPTLRLIVAGTLIGLAACTSPSETPDPNAHVITPPPVSGLRYRITASSAYHNCAIAADSTAWCWGENGSGQLGFNTGFITGGSAGQYSRPAPSATPGAVVGHLKFTQIAAIGATCIAATSLIQSPCGQTCALAPDGTAYCWGGPYSGGGSITPAVFGAGTHFKTLDVAGSLANPQICGLDLTSKAVCITSAAGNTPIGGGKTFTALAVGDAHACGIADDGITYCWGSNAAGQLGIGTADTTTHVAPVAVTSSVPFVAIGAGSTGTCALGSDGQLYCWGESSITQCSQNPSPCTPQPLALAVKFTSFRFAGSQVCGVTTAGTAQCLIGVTAQVNTYAAPAPVVAVGAGQPSCFLLSTGMTYCISGGALVLAPGQ